MPGCHGRLAGVMGGLVGIAVGMVVEDLAERPVELHVGQRRSQSRRHHRRDLAFGLTTSLAWRAWFGGKLTAIWRHWGGLGDAGMPVGGGGLVDAGGRSCASLQDIRPVHPARVCPFRRSKGRATLPVAESRANRKRLPSPGETGVGRTGAVPTTSAVSETVSKHRGRWSIRYFPGLRTNPEPVSITWQTLTLKSAPTRWQAIL